MSAACPIVILEPDLFSLDEVDLESDGVGADTCIPQTSLSTFQSSHRHFEEYAASFTPFIEALCQHQFDKLVLSRSLVLARESSFSVAKAFFSACEQYLYSYVYLFYTPLTGMWMGSTPEIMLSGEQGTFSTVALAGTQSLQEGKLPQEWSAKNRVEQAYVATYIREQLLSLDIHPTETAAYPIFAGALSHLKSDFHFSLSRHNELGHLLNRLHPTPAVCGLPKEEAYRFIQQNEGHDRRYYAGFVGWIDPAGRTDLYVNLRCMQIDQDRLTLYAGGGLLASSELEDEWQETEKKLQTMKAMIDR